MATQSPQSPLVSPEVMPDGRVTFRLLAPEAGSVVARNTTSGYGDWPDGNDVAMSKDDAGVWSATIGPLAPEQYSYVFVVDGALALDPRNSFIVRDGARYSSQLPVPGEGSALYGVDDIPHGTVSQVWYPSPSLGFSRRMYVYTPAGYEAGGERYPVFYLLHGGGDDEDAWSTMGRAPQILDHVIASGQAQPMIVVMTNGNANQRASQDYVPAPPDLFVPAFTPANVPGQRNMVRPDIFAFPKSLISDVIPFVDQVYRTKADREHRAIAGLSMGGAQTLFATFNNLDKFAYVAAFSAGLPLIPGVAIDIPAPENAARLRGPDITRTIDPAKMAALMPQLNAADANSRLKFFGVYMGTEDGLITAHGAFKTWLDAQGIDYSLMELPGYSHEWRFWRICLADYAPKLFQS
jgi:enterochelin esterase-like enzyme